MRTWFWTVVTVCLAVFVAFAIHRFPGNVLIVVDQWRVQVSLAFAILMTIAGFVAVYVLIRVLTWLSQMPDRYRGWRGQRQEKREQSMLEQGWTALLEGRYTHAEKMLTRLSGQSGDKRRQVLATLSAARAAHEVGEFARQDELIKQAQKAASSQSADVELNTAVAAAAADLWLQQGRAVEALGALQVDHVQPMRHLHTMRLMLRVYQQTHHHQKVLELARALKKKQALPTQEADQIIEVAAAALIRSLSQAATAEANGLAAGVVGQGNAVSGDVVLASATSNNAAHSWQACWKELKSEEKVLPEVALAGAQAFQAAGEYREATKTLEAALKERFEAKLLAAYARAQPEQVTPRLQKAEQWLEQRKQQNGDNPAGHADLLTTLGSLCLAAQMWGQAQRYLEQSAKLRKDARVHALLGSLFDRIGQPQKAAQHWRLATAVSAALPTLAQDATLPSADTDLDPVIPHSEGLGDYDEGSVLEQAQVDPSDTSNRSNPSDPSGYEEFFDSAPVVVGHYESVDERSVDDRSVGKETDK